MVRYLQKGTGGNLPRYFVPHNNGITYLHSIPILSKFKKKKDDPWIDRRGEDRSRESRGF
jgi:hypothetical protein